MPEPSDITRLRRIPERGAYDRETIYRILDQNFLVHIGFIDGDQTFVIPTAYCRHGDAVFIHGSSASRMLKVISATSQRVCATVTSVQDFVVAKSAFHHSINYESVVLFGTCTEITDREEKSHYLFKIMEHLIPGRWDESRVPNEKELKGTMVIRFAIEEASAKIRKGSPKDDLEDEKLEIWSGLIPIETKASPPPESSKSIRHFKLPKDR